MQVINVNNVSVVDGNNIILRDISFDVDMGTFVSIIGKNGSGKSTLIKLLAGFLRYSGYIDINGYFLDDIGIRDIRKVASVVFDNMNEELLGNTVWECLAMNLINLGKSENYIKNRLGEVCSLFGIDKDLLNKKMILLDNSLRQKILIASAIMSRPSILFLDDCLSLLSGRDKHQVIGILKKLCIKDKMTVLMVTNNVEDVLESNEVIVLDNGEIMFKGNVKNIFRDIKKISKYNFDLPLIVELSIKLIDEGIINNIYLDDKKLVGALWK